MRPWPLLLVLLLLAPAAVRGDAAEDTYLAKITGDRVRVRRGPGRSHRVLDLLARGETVIVEGSSADWIRVRIPGGVPCWVREDMVEVRGDEAIVTKTRVQMRPTPGTAYLPLDARLDRGEKLLVIGKAEMEGGEPAWYRVLSPDRTPLWVHRDYLEKVGPVPEDLAEMGRGRVERVQNRMREEEKADSVARRDDALRDRIAKVQSQLKAASGKPEEDLSPLKAELEAVLAEAEFRLTKLEAASVFKDILLLEKQRELAKARAVAEATEEELREAIRLADERYQEALKGLAKLAPVRELGFTAIGWVHYRRGEWVIEKGAVSLYVLRSELFSIRDFSGKKVGVRGRMVGEDPGRGLRILQVEAIEIFSD
jgi:uncharacterized protein YgiM (DUF1202 family)